MLTKLENASQADLTYWLISTAEKIAQAGESSFTLSLKFAKRPNSFIINFHFKVGEGFPYVTIQSHHPRWGLKEVQSMTLVEFSQSNFVADLQKKGFTLRD